MIDLSKIYWGIDNLAEKCHEDYMKTPVEQMNIDQKLEIIQVSCLACILIVDIWFYSIFNNISECSDKNICKWKNKLE